MSEQHRNASPEAQEFATAAQEFYQYQQQTGEAPGAQHDPNQPHPVKPGVRLRQGEPPEAMTPLKLEQMQQAAMMAMKAQNGAAPPVQQVPGDAHSLAYSLTELVSHLEQSGHEVHQFALTDKTNRLATIVIQL